MSDIKVPYEIEKEVSLAELSGQAIDWIRSRFVFLLGSLLVGASVGYYFFATTPPQYVGRSIGYANNLSDIRLREIIGDLDAYRNAGQTQKLADALGLPVADAGTITGLSGLSHNALESDLPYPARETKVFFFAIDIKGFQPELFSKVQEGIVRYVNGLDYVKSRLAYKSGTLQTTIEKITAELAYLENIKRLQEGTFGKGQLFMGDPGAVSVHVIDLEEKLLMLQEEKKYMANEMVITKGVNINMRPVTPGYIRSSIAGAAYGLATMLAIFLLQGVMRKRK